MCCRLALDKGVREKALQVRLQYMKTLEDLFKERQKLNIEAVRVLLPPQVGAQLIVTTHACFAMRCSCSSMQLRLPLALDFLLLCARLKSCLY